MKPLLYIPFGVQGVLMFFDEFYFHRKRGLGLWERVGHPIDSFSVLACYLFLHKYPYNQNHLKMYVVLSCISCVLITKDEFIHKLECDALECWLHGILFVLHPIVLMSAGILWYFRADLSIFIQTTSAFMIYQIIYWQIFHRKKIYGDLD